MDGLSLQLRIAYDDYKTDYDFNQYALIHNYDFQSVTSDFVDWRLYLDYVFKKSLSLFGSLYVCLLVTDVFQ